MIDLSDEVKAQLAKKVESKLIGFHVISLLKMMLNTPDIEKESHNKSGHIKDHHADAKETVAGIIDLISQTVRTEEIPDQKGS
jgi:hypothetical protein